MTYFWLSIGFMAGIAVAFFVVQLWSTKFAASSRRARWIAAASGAGFLLVAGAMYIQIGRPGLSDSAQTATGAGRGQSDGNAAGATGSMEEATAKLASRLAAGDGSDEDWQLLQQSYAFLGDSEAADLALQHRLKPETGAPVSVVAPTAGIPRATSDQAALTTYQNMVAKNPADATSWLAIAHSQRTARNFTEAKAAFEKAIMLKAMDADAWADYADVSASVAGTLTNTNTRNALDAALKLAPQHNKALWLKASLAHEEHNYASALALWKKLRAVVPDSSPDAAIIDANINEAQSLVGVVTSDKTSNAMAQVSGSVALDAAIKSQVTSDMTLFVYAKATDSPAPVAAYRTTVKSWPVKFVLDDTLAMMPTRKLSQYDTVMVSARLSRSGQAIAQTGDLQTDTVMVDTHSKQNLALHISAVVP